jgi:hypothetical protein
MLTEQHLSASFCRIPLVRSNQFCVAAGIAEYNNKPIKVCGPKDVTKALRSIYYYAEHSRLNLVEFSFTIGSIR